MKKIILQGIDVLLEKKENSSSQIRLKSLWKTISKSSALILVLIAFFIAPLSSFAQSNGSKSIQNEQDYQAAKAKAQLMYTKIINNQTDYAAEQLNEYTNYLWYQYLEMDNQAEVSANCAHFPKPIFDQSGKLLNGMEVNNWIKNYTGELRAFTQIFDPNFNISKN